MRTSLALLVTTIALTAAACGGSAENTSGTAAASGVASAAPASAALFLELNADLDSAQWQEVQGLADDIRAGKGLFKDFFDQAAKGADWAAVDAAFGPVLALVALEDGETAVVLTQPDDVEKLKSLLGEKGTPAAAREVGGWTAVAQKEADLVAYEEALGKGALAGDEAFDAAMADLPAETIVRVYAGGEGLAKALSTAAGEAGATDAAGGALGGLGIDPSALSALGGAGALTSLAATVDATDGALVVKGSLEGSEEAGTPYAPTFLEKIPAGVIAAAGWHGTEDLLSQLRSNAGLAETVAQLETALGVTLDQLGPLLAGEGALFVRSGLALPEITLALEVADAPGALATLDGIVKRLGGLTEGTTSDTTVDGVPAKVLDLGIAKLTYAAVDGLLIATTSPTGITAFRAAEGDKLADDPIFAKAADKAGFGETTSGFVYADVAKVGELLSGLGGVLGGALGGEGGDTGELVPAEGFDGFGTLFAHGTAEGKTVRFAAVLTVT